MLLTDVLFQMTDDFYFSAICWVSVKSVRNCCKIQVTFHEGSLVHL